jgi:hypothetical protein
MKMLMAIGAGILGYCYYRGRESQRLRATRHVEIGRWEGEGGNVPSVATPSPAPMPRSSYPPGEPGTRH